MPHGLNADTVGPVDVAVIAFPGNHFHGAIVPALQELQHNGTVHILDLTFVKKGTDGTTLIVELSDTEIAEAFHHLADTQFDLLSDADLQAVADDLAPESSAMIIVWENTWAARLSTALRDSQGDIMMLERIPRKAVLAAIAALDSN
ncbi:DUF6325 family protein [Streptomyces kunmingensis]|uniref:DUF6325 family protein n=1 Tax=Streptomyces kunmingensis TaxID=68225 RepID=A0ABU6C343_9ACTN|nr:DUF6325 family protein [Streptomyces kunmingensis]MEB3959138.1 DUF6325 family protein [Streptomyces kunmingensis]